MYRGTDFASESAVRRTMPRSFGKRFGGNGELFIKRAKGSAERREIFRLNARCRSCIANPTTNAQMWPPVPPEGKSERALPASSAGKSKTAERGALHRVRFLSDALRAGTLRLLPKTLSGRFRVPGLCPVTAFDARRTGPKIAGRPWACVARIARRRETAFPIENGPEPQSAIRRRCRLPPSPCTDRGDSPWYRNARERVAACLRPPKARRFRPAFG